MRDTIREQALQDRGWKFVYEAAVPLSAVRVTEGTKRQIRLGQEVDPIYKERLVRALRGGAQLPAITLAKMPAVDGYELADGIHRTAAFGEIGQETTDAYVVEVDGALHLEFLRRSANAISAKGMPQEEAVLQAVALVQAGLTATEAARLMGVSDAAVTTRLRALATIDRIARTPGIESRGRKVPTFVLDVLGRIKRDDLFAKAIEIAHATTLSRERAADLANAAVMVTDDASAKTLIGEWRDTYGETVKASKAPSVKSIQHAPIARLARAISSFKAAVRAWDNAVDPGRMNAEQRKQASEALRFVAAECVNRAIEIDSERFAARHARAESGRRKSGPAGRRAGAARPA